MRSPSVAYSSPIPDLVERIKENRPLNPPDRSTFYGGGAHGYPTYEARRSCRRMSNSTPGAIASRLVGVWKLVSYTVEQEGHENSLPFGPNQRASSFIRPMDLYRHS